VIHPLPGTLPSPECPQPQVMPWSFGPLSRRQHRPQRGRARRALGHALSSHTAMKVGRAAAGKHVLRCPEEQ